jgi:hypothetical protein
MNLHAMRHQSGTCQKIVNGKPCGKPFVGPKSRKYCDDHSAHVKYAGRG